MVNTDQLIILIKQKCVLKIVKKSKTCNAKKIVLKNVTIPSTLNSGIILYI